MSYTLRPLPDWPHKPTSPRKDAQFRSPSRREGDRWIPSKPISWEQTRRELQYEVDQLSDSRYETDITIGVGLTEYDIRQDGAPRANARPMLHPGVEISFDSRYGRLLGRELVARYGGVREALQATHPDTGGETANERDFDAVMAFKKASAA